MKTTKHIISDLTLCYCVAPLMYKGKKHFLVASEKEYACLLFDEKGRQVDTIWDGPGGTMSIVQIPGEDGVFLAVQKFYSPNNSKEAKIVLVKPDSDKWSVQTIAELPHVHRFDILSRNGVNYLLACCLKSDYEYKDDWRFPGMTLACRLPDDLIDYPMGKLLTLEPLKVNMMKNHGYCRSSNNGVACGLVACDSGVYRFTPPESDAENWSVEQLLSEPCSDVVDVDFDNCGDRELLVISPFHGDTLKVYKRTDNEYRLVWEFEEKLNFLHAICRCEIEGRKSAVIGYRRDERNLLLVKYVDREYGIEIIDHDVGSANVMFAELDNKKVIISANREINEVAYYIIEE